METLNTYCIKKMDRYAGTVSYSDMRFFLNQTNPKTFEHGLKLLLTGVQSYIEAYEKANGVKISADFYSAPYVEELLRSLRGLLSAQGRFDGGTLDGFICDLAEQAGLNIE